jgi:NADH-quinone oxidoreductase subunit J
MSGESIIFWALAPLTVLAALGMLLVKKAVHSAILLAFVMIALAVFYLIQDAPFLGVVQVVVYTGAVMMLFLFILMLVGVDSSDSLVENIKGIRWVAIFTSLAFALTLVSLIARATTGEPVRGLEEANAAGNVQALAFLLFGDFVLAFEVISALLITAAVGAMVLAHTEKSPTARISQRIRSAARFRGESIGTAAGLPGSGVFARHNALDVPALLPDGTPSDLSVPSVVTQRGDVQETRRYSLEGLPKLEGEGDK